MESAPGIARAAKVPLRGALLEHDGPLPQFRCPVGRDQSRDTAADHDHVVAGWLLCHRLRPSAEVYSSLAITRLVVMRDYWLSRLFFDLQNPAAAADFVSRIRASAPAFKAGSSSATDKHDEHR